MDITQSLRNRFESYLEGYFIPTTLVDFDTDVKLINNRLIVQYFIYTVNHKYTINLFRDNDGIDTAYVTMKPRMADAGSDTVPVFEIWGGRLSKEAFHELFMTILSNETVSVVERKNKARLQFEGRKLVWK